MNMLKSEVEEKVKQCVSESMDVPVSEIKLTDRIVEDFGADSLDIVELIVELEDTFSIEISDEEAEKLLTVTDVINFIEKSKA